MKDATEIIVVLDRSGSMSTIRGDMEGGFDQFISEQRNAPGECRVSLYQFDDKYDVVFEGRALADVPKCVIEPRAATALLDAVGKTINATGERLASKAESERPDKIVFLVITDGHENASREFKKADIKKLVERQSKDYNWQFCYIGADLGAFDEGASIAMAAASYVPDAAGTKDLYGRVGAAVVSYRSGVSASLSVEKNPEKVSDTTS